MGEFDLIAWVRQRSPTGGRALIGIGDDCALLSVPSGRGVLATTDMLMDGRHFRLERDGAEAVGYKALAVNLSDIAAMAGTPTAALVAVALPRARAAELAQGLHAGMQSLCERFGVALVGGDTNAWDGPLVVSVTVLGEPTGRGAVRRSGARPGDSIFVSGPLGGSLLGRHLRPEPRIVEARTLHEQVALHALIDISDGLAADLGHILEESGGLGALLLARGLPIHPDAEILARRDGRTPLHHALNDGEDFELCAVVGPQDLGRVDQPPWTCIGTVVAEPGLRLRFADGAIVPIVAQGWDHFRSSEALG